MERRESDTWLCLTGGKTAEELLLEDRHKHDFIGKHLPFSLDDDDTFEPVRYELGDGWLELMILYFPGWGWDVHVLDQSCEEIGLGDVYHDIQSQLRMQLTIEQRPAVTKQLDPRVDDILERLERLESEGMQPLAANTVESPYLNSQEAATYLRMNVNALYSLVERRKLRPLPGHRKYRFTKEMLDNFLRGK